MHDQDLLNTVPSLPIPLLTSVHLPTYFVSSSHNRLSSRWPISSLHLDLHRLRCQRVGKLNGTSSTKNGTLTHFVNLSPATRLLQLASTSSSIQFHHHLSLTLHSQVLCKYPHQTIHLGTTHLTRLSYLWRCPIRPATLLRWNRQYHRRRKNLSARKKSSLQQPLW